MGKETIEGGKKKDKRGMEIPENIQKYEKKLKANMNFEAGGNVDVKCACKNAILLAFAQQG